MFGNAAPRILRGATNGPTTKPIQTNWEKSIVRTYPFSFAEKGCKTDGYGHVIASEAVGVGLALPRKGAASGTPTDIFGDCWSSQKYPTVLVCGESDSTTTSLLPVSSFIAKRFPQNFRHKNMPSIVPVHVAGKKIFSNVTGAVCLVYKIWEAVDKIYLSLFSKALPD
jgi:hypothetical protein